MQFYALFLQPTQKVSSILVVIVMHWLYFCYWFFGWSRQLICYVLTASSSGGWDRRWVRWGWAGGLCFW